MLIFETYDRPDYSFESQQSPKEYGRKFYLRVTADWLMKNLPFTGLETFSH